MFGKVKKILGIEGVKIELLAPSEVSASQKSIKGKIILQSLSDQTVKSIELKLIEKYSRGRKDAKLIDEYVIGNSIIKERIEIKKDQKIEIEFDVPFVRGLSEMDRIERSNFFAKGLVKLAKLAKKVKSEFRIEAEATVVGTKLQPVAKQEVIIK